jgi:hypothetical protein
MASKIQLVILKLACMITMHMVGVMKDAFKLTSSQKLVMMLATMFIVIIKTLYAVVHFVPLTAHQKCNLKQFAIVIATIKIVIIIIGLVHVL